MLRSPKAQTVLVLSVGLLAGYAAATGKLNPFAKADARPPQTPSAFGRPADGSVPAGYRANGQQADHLLAAHSNAFQQKAGASGKKPNLLVLWGDDIGYWNLSISNRGMMGYRTPNIDRIAKEGTLFTDCYAQQSCTASG